MHAPAHIVRPQPCRGVGVANGAGGPLQVLSLSMLSQTQLLLLLELLLLLLLDQAW